MVISSFRLTTTRTQHAEILDEIVGERIVVIDDQSIALIHRVARLIASTIAIALFTVS